jgi:deoxyribodipyrimidine photo-lyase
VLLPNPSSTDVVHWVQTHLGSFCCDEVRPSPRFRGTQAAADEALATFSVTGYSKRRSEVFPVSRRGASGLSPWIRHGLLTLPRMWTAAAPGPASDVDKFRDELLWAEYSRHIYARLGSALATDLRGSRSEILTDIDPWDPSMACMSMVVEELETDGWMVNQTRMWLASQWSVRHGAPWLDGEDRFFTHLLDGSRAANRTGWQWTVGTGNGKSYGFSRWQVEKRAPGLCDGCAKRHACPIQQFPEDESLYAIDPHPGLRGDANPDVAAGPRATVRSAAPSAVWLTAESLGDDDPALAAHADLPVVFVFDQPLLTKLRLSGKRLVFLTERLAELAESRTVSIHLGRPAEVLAGQPVATTYAPVPGWKRIAAKVAPVEVHPWPWLRRPGSGSLMSFSAWNGRPPQGQQRGGSVRGGSRKGR